MCSSNPENFLSMRKSLSKELRATVQHINRLLSQALAAGVKISVEVEGHPRFNVGVLGDGDGGQEIALAAWALRLKVKADRKQYPQGGTPYGAMAYCDWKPKISAAHGGRNYRHER